MAKDWKKHNAERDRLMAMVPAKLPPELPPEVDAFINDVCLGSHHYLFYNRRYGDQYCTHCQKSIDRRYILSPKHNQVIQCPQCNYELLAVCVGKFKHQEIKSDDFQLRVMQRTPEGILIRRFCLIRKCLNWRDTIKEQLLWWEMQRIFNDGTMVKRYRKIVYTETGETINGWKESKKKDFVTRSNMGFMGYVSQYEEFDYVANIREVIEGTCFQYSEMAKKQQYPIHGDVLDYFSGWIKPEKIIEHAAGTGWPMTSSRMTPDT